MCRILASFLACFMLIMVSYTLSDAKSDKFRTKGTVTSVNEEEQMFTIKNKHGETISFKVERKSDFEIERSIFDDKDISFSELKVGDEVKVKAYKGEPPVADDVTIYRK